MCSFIVDFVGFAGFTGFVGSVDFTGVGGITGLAGFVGFINLFLSLLRVHQLLCGHLAGLLALIWACQICRCL